VRGVEQDLSSQRVQRAHLDLVGGRHASRPLAPAVGDRPVRASTTRRRTTSNWYGHHQAGARLFVVSPRRGPVQVAVRRCRVALGGGRSSRRHSAPFERWDEERLTPIRVPRSLGNTAAARRED
jgi:hypothetical protein